MATSLARGSWNSVPACYASGNGGFSAVRLLDEVSTRATRSAGPWSSESIRTSQSIPGCQTNARAITVGSIRTVTTGIRIGNVPRAHAPSIIAPWLGSGRRSDSGQPLRHDGDSRTG